MNNLPDNPQINSQTLRPFTKFCMSIGAIPSSYLLSLSYEEQLLWLCDYLQNTVIPAVNNNADAVTELQNLYIELKSYVDNYFKNLDVQQEINNKLDDMAEDGTLASIINDELLGQINQDISSIKNTLNVMETMPTIMIGDSYGAGHSSPSYVTGWCDLLAKMLDISQENGTYYKVAIGSTGFNPPSADTFLEMIQSLEDTITNKSKIKRIIVCAGYNDANNNQNTYNSLLPIIKNFISYCNTTYPKATVYLGMIAYNTNFGEKYVRVRTSLQNIVLPAYYNACVQNSTTDKNNAVYLSGVENVAKYPSLYSSDHLHPTQEGYYQITQAIYNALIQGYASYHQRYATDVPVNITSDLLDETSNFSFSRTIFDNVAFCRFYGSLLFKNAYSPTGYFEFTDGSPVSARYSFLLGTTNFRLTCLATVTMEGGSKQLIPAEIVCRDTGNFAIYLDPNSFKGNILRISFMSSSTTMLPCGIF